MMVAYTAPAPKISTGIYRGNTSIEIKTLLLRNPNVSAAPTDQAQHRSAKDQRHYQYA